MADRRAAGPRDDWHLRFYSSGRTNASNKPAKMPTTVSPPGHESYFEELDAVVSRGVRPDAEIIAELRSRYNTDQILKLQK